MNTWKLSCLCLMFVLTACGGGSSSGGGITTDFIDRSGNNITSKGAVSAFGSVIVNGVKYDTSSAVFVLDDQVGSETSLAVGELVLVVGELTDSSSGVATEISSDPTLLGNATAIDQSAKSFIILKTNVLTNANTLWDTSTNIRSFAELSENDRVEVYGFRNSQGDVVASLIRETSDTDFEIAGRISSLDSTQMRFSIGDLSVDFTNANLVDFSQPIANTDLVEVEGTTLNAQGTLLATRVELEQGLAIDQDDDGQSVEYSGLISTALSGTTFELDGTTVRINANTEFEDGTDADLILNAQVEVEGVVNELGEILAEQVEFESEPNFEAEGRVESIDVGQQQLTLFNSIFTVSPQTSLLDESDSQLRNFGLTDLVVGDWIKIKARIDTPDNVLTLLQRKNPEDRAKLSGSIDTLSSPDLIISTVRITTKQATSFEDAGVQVSSTDFFATVQPGRDASAEGELVDNGVMTADSVEASQ